MSSTLGSPLQITGPRYVEDVDAVADVHAEDADFSGWFCIRTQPFPCPAKDCGYVADFATAAHLILVWPARDDFKLLEVARDCRVYDRDPRIVEYERGFGACIPYDRWVRVGRPVHGRNPKPDGWDDMGPLR